MDRDGDFLSGGGTPGKRQRPDARSQAGRSLVDVSGVPRFFANEWLAERLTVLWVVLAVLGALDLLLALANLGSDVLAMVVNLVSGAVGIAAAVVIQGIWRPADELLGRLSVACMFVLWLTAGWTVVTAAVQIGFIHQGILTAPFYLVGTILTMIVMGTGASVIKTRVTQHVEGQPAGPSEGQDGESKRETRWSTSTIVLAVIGGVAILAVLPAVYGSWQTYKTMAEFGDGVRGSQTSVENSPTSAASDEGQRWSPILAMEMPEQSIRVPKDNPNLEVWQYPYAIHDASDEDNGYDSVVVRKIAKQFPGNGWPRCAGVPGTWSNGTSSISVEFFFDDDDVLLSVISDAGKPCPTAGT